MPDLLTCPFCRQGEHNAISLKYHLLGYCEAFQAVPGMFDRTVGGEFVAWTPPAERE